MSKLWIHSILMKYELSSTNAGSLHGFSLKVRSIWKKLGIPSFYKHVLQFSMHNIIPKKFWFHQKFIGIHSIHTLHRIWPQFPLNSRMHCLCVYFSSGFHKTLSTLIDINRQASSWSKSTWVDVDVIWE